MWDDYEILKVRVLLVFLKGDPDTHTVVRISKTLNVTKQRISRLLMDLENEGIIDRSNPRHPKLTEKGEKTASFYAERVTISLNHLLFEGVSIEKAEQDAYHWAIYNTDETMDVIKSAAAVYHAKYELRHLKEFNGDVLCRKLGDGVYRFNFVIYKEHVKNGSNLSMANDGFEHPGNLIVKNGRGKVQLRIMSISARSPMDERELTGKVTCVKYLEHGDFYAAEISDDIVSFPAAILNFVNIGENINQMLHGSVCLKMKCHMEAFHMPESIAIFSAFF